MKLHHIGKVVKDIGAQKEYYQHTFGLDAVSDVIHDPIQKVDVLLVDMGPGHAVSLELISPVGDGSPVNKFLQDTGGGLHHLCYEVDNLEDTMQELRGKGALILGKPVPSAGHNNRTTVWVYTAERELIELIE